jgi:hypothetical protein
LGCLTRAAVGVGSRASPVPKEGAYTVRMDASSTFCRSGSVRVTANV